MSPLSEQAISFSCEGNQLVGILHLPAAEPRPVGIVIVVGGPQYRVGSHRQFVLMARQFAKTGFAVMRFDYRGMGDSDGEPRSFEAVDADIRVAIDELLRQVDGLTGVVLFGLCDAASAVCMYVAQDQRVRGIILANPWVRTLEGEARGRVRHHYAQRILQKSFWAKLISGRMEFCRSISEFFQSIRHAGTSTMSPSTQAMGFQERMCRGLESFKGPALLLLSGRDLTAREFEDACARSVAWTQVVSRPSFTTFKLPDADHTFSVNAELQQLSNRCIAWAEDVPRA